MKLKIYSMLAASLLVMGSCAEQEEVGTPVQTGDEISFGISTPGEVKTRTIYGTPVDNGDGTGYFPIYWEQDDEIAIYCPQAVQPATQLVHYKITPDPNDKSTSSAVTRVGDVGLQWGDRDTEHRFYGFYPASAVKGTETDGRIISEIPVLQSVNGWIDNGKDVGTGKVYTGTPDTKFAYMFAYTAVTPSNLTTENADIPLKFSPLVTILEVEVNGPKSGNPVKVTNINVTSSDGTPLAGNFECLISDRSGTCTPVNDATVTNRVSVSCYDNDKDDFIELGVGDKLKVKLFLLPYTDHNINKGSLKVTVSTLNGAARTKTLQTADVVSQCVNRVSLPALVSNDDTNYWMSNLDRDIYFSELSIPGSFMAAGTSDNTGLLHPTYYRYQNKSLTQQFKDGIRFFNFQLDYQNNIFSAGETINKTLDDAYTEIKAAVEQAKLDLSGKRECLDFAVIQVNYKATASWDVVENPRREQWIKNVSQKINGWASSDGVVIEPTVDMTLGDLGGKVVFIIRYISGPMVTAMNGIGDFSSVYLNWPGEEVKVREIGIQYGNPNNAAGELMFIHQDISDVTPQDGSYGGEYSPVEGETYTRVNPDGKMVIVKQLFERGVTDYESNESLTVPMKNWYYNNLGGFCRVENDGVGGDTYTYTEYIHPLVVDYLQARTQNASLGLVMMNFADKQGDSGAKYKSDWLIQTIIDNNFKFALRKKSSGVTPAPSYNASYKSGGNAVGWDE